METKKLKIIQIATFFHPVTGGVETQVEEISEHLIEKGHEVEVYTSNSSRNETEISEKYSKLGELKITRFKTWLSFSKFHKLFPGILIKLSKTDFDVLHVHGLRKPELYLALIVAKWKKKKIVVTTHNPFTADNFRNPKLTRFIKIHDKTIGKWFMRYVDKVIYISPEEKAILIDKFKLKPDQLAYIPNGINEMYFKPAEVQKEEVIKEFPMLENKWNGIVLAACRMNEVKGIQNLKYAVDNLEDHLFLFIGGDDGYLGKLKGMYRNHPNVIFTEKYLKKEVLRGLMEYIDVFVLPSIHEPFGLTIVEATAAGVPVLATTKGGPPFVLDKSFAKFIDPEDQVRWKEEIEKITNNVVNVEEKIKLGKEFVQKYRWRNIIPLILQTYI